MHDKMRAVTKYMPKDPHLWCALVAGCVFLILEILRVHWVSDELVPVVGMSIVIVCLVVLIADRLKESNDARENADRVTRIFHSTFHKRVTIRNCPCDPEGYDDLWGGFTGDYFVYNPSYNVDDSMGTDETAKIFLQRYRHPRFGKAKYLFLTKDHEGQKALNTFRAIMAKVKQAQPDILRKVKVKENKKKAACSAPEMYLGTRHGERLAVLESKSPTSFDQHGTPPYYLVIHDGDVLENLEGEHLRAWTATEVHDVEI